MAFKKATKHQAKLRLALVGPSGSGKTYTALRIAKGLGGRVAVIDTERGSASKYANDVAEFDVQELETFSPRSYVDAIHEAEREGYDVLIVDSLTQAWSGKGGALEMVDKAAKRSQSGNSFTAWRDVTPEYNALVDAIVGAHCHVIATMRAKTEYVLEEDSRGKKTPRKIGMAPIQRDGLEYEFDVVADLTLDHDFMVSKSRCAALDKAVINEAGENVAAMLRAWLTDGAPAVERPKVQTPCDAVCAALAAAQNAEEVEKARALAKGKKFSSAEITRMSEAQHDALARIEQEAAERALASQEEGQAAQ